MHGRRRMIRVTKKEVVRQDYYDLRGFPPDYFDVIVDLGANIGMFSLYARFLQPNAKIIAVEPCPNVFGDLKQNARFMDIELMNCALGDGEPLYQINSTACCPQFASASEAHITEDDIRIDSATLADIFDRFEIPLTCKYFIKIDCEGGERFAFVDSSNEIFAHAAQAAMELHHAERHGPHMPSFDDFMSYLMQFSGTHDITHKSRKGTTRCIMRKKTISL